MNSNNRKLKWKKKKFWCYFSAIILLIPLICPCIGQEIESSLKGKVFRAALPHVPGYTYRNEEGLPDGFPCQMLIKMAEDEGIMLEWVDGTWSECFEKTKSGDIDILPGTDVTEERKAYFDYMEEALYSLWSELYVKEEIDFLLSNLNGRKIALSKNDNNSIQFRKYIANYEIDYIPVEFNSHSEALEALSKGKVFAAVGARPFNRDHLKEMELKSSGLYYNPAKLTYAFPKGKNSDLIKVLDNRLRLYKDDPESFFYQMIRKYGLGSRAIREEVIPERVRLVLGSLGAVALLGIVFVLILKHQVNSKTATIRAKEQELKEYSLTLEKKVARRTKELDSKNQELSEALDDVKTSQQRLITSEKMAVLGSLSAGIAHEINSPLGAIGSASGVISKNAVSLLDDFEKISAWVKGQYGKEIRSLFGYVVSNQDYSQTLSTKECREARNDLALKLAENGIDDSKEYARLLIELRLDDKWNEYIAFLRSGQSYEVLLLFAKLTEVLRGCGMIDVAVGKASRIVKALKTYIYKGDDLDVDFEIRPVDIRSSIENVLLLFHNHIKQGIHLETSFMDVPRVMGDSEQLSQVWTNLIHNALQAMGDSGELAVSLYRDGASEVVEIADNGCGIPEDIQDKIFEPLFTTKGTGEGTGLGLDITKRIIEAHQGCLKIESRPGQGTKIKVYLPITDNCLV